MNNNHLVCLHFLAFEITEEVTAVIWTHNLLSRHFLTTLLRDTCVQIFLILLNMHEELQKLQFGLEKKTKY